jgi:plasmid replication initiation protein
LEKKLIRKNKKKTKKVEYENQLIFQHNNLVEARYRLSLQEKRVILWLSSQVNPNDEDFKEHVLPIKEFAKLIGARVDGTYAEVQEVTKRLMQRVLSIYPLGEDVLIQVAWLGGALYQFKEGTVSLSFSPHLRPFLLNLKSHFTAMNLSDLMNLKSIYAVRLFELLKQYEKVGERVLSIEDIRDSCGIAASQYKKFNDFKRYVLDAAQREINEKTDILINLEFLKEARRITSVSFSIKKNPNYNLSSEQKQTNKKIEKLECEAGLRTTLVDRIMSLGFSKPTITKMISDLTDAYVHEAVTAVFNQIEKGGVTNPKAMMRTALKEGWKPDAFKVRRSKRGM